MQLEKLAQNPLENLIENGPQRSQFIGLEKLGVGSQIGLSVDRPTVRFLAVELAVDRPGRPRPGYREQALCPVDRPSSQAGVHVLCTSVDRLQAPSTGPVDRQKPGQVKLGI